MAIVWTHQLHQDREGTVVYTGNNGAIVTYKQRYQVLTDDATNNEAYVLANAAIPQPFDEHSYDATAKAVTFNAVQVDDSRLLWDVDVEFTNDVNKLTGEGVGPAVTRSWSGVTVPRVILKDTVTGQFRTNSAGVPYAPSDSTFPRNHTLVTFTRNEGVFFDSTIVQYQNHVNSTGYKGFTEEFLLCRNISAQEIFVTDIDQGVLFSYFSVSYSFEYAPEGWKDVRLDEGFMHYPRADGPLVPIWINGSQVTEPWPLDGNGTALTEAQIQAGTFFTRQFTVYETQDFNQLGL